jgi:hypothetical protein
LGRRRNPSLSKCPGNCTFAFINVRAKHELTTPSLGSDGPWSTLMMRVGTPPQFLKMLVSTSSPETLVVDAEGCQSEDTKDCPTDRGSIFEPKNSSTWEDFKNGTTYPLDDDRGIHIRGNGSYGSDVVHITNRQVNADLDMDLPHHIIAQISTKDYFLGSST